MNNQHTWSEWYLVDFRILYGPYWERYTLCCDPYLGGLGKWQVKNSFNGCPPLEEISESGLNKYFSLKKEFPNMKSPSFPWDEN